MTKEKLIPTWAKEASKRIAAKNEAERKAKKSGSDITAEIKKQIKDNVQHIKGLGDNIKVTSYNQNLIGCEGHAILKNTYQIIVLKANVETNEYDTLKKFEYIKDGKFLYKDYDELINTVSEYINNLFGAKTKSHKKVDLVF